jgi:hypothetical protein
MRMLTLSTCLVAVLVAAPAFSQPSISFESNVVTISRVTPGGRVTWLGVSREQPEYYRTVVIRRDGILVDEDRDGTVVIELDEEIPERSLWIAVDVASGTSAAATVDPLDDLPLIVSLATPGKPGTGLVELLADRHDFLEVLLVRPSVGAWRASAGDGGASDDDGTPNGRIRLRPGAMKALGEAPELDGPARPGDVIAYVDVRTLEYGIVPLGPKW